MSANNWANILDLLIENPQSITAKLIERSPDTGDLVKLAEEAYIRLGFPKLPNSFWAQSEFNNVRGNCHPTAVNMFAKDDVRYVKIISALDTLHGIYFTQYEPA